VPQTLTEISELLAARGMRPAHKLGQHFLIDLNLMRILVERAAVGPRDVVLEVGCGTGSLTQLLAERAARVIAVDIDPRMIEIAREQTSGRDNVRFVHADILRGKNRLNPQVMEPTLAAAAAPDAGRLLLVSNLPYGAGTPVIANIVSSRLPFAGLWVTVQKEVADRLAASPGNKDYGPLTVTVQAGADVEVFRKVPPSAFWPRPEVDSAMVAIVPSPAKAAQIADVEIFDALVGGVFTQRRKAMRSAVRAIRHPAAERADWAALLRDVGVDDGARPDHATIEQYLALTAALSRPSG
jgi:16S rRNA (adenine1518-N6/adenine1519-N6)-dimethyltransferase